MLDALKAILKIQDLDMKMIRLMRLKQERQKELSYIHGLREDLVKQLQAKEDEIMEVKKGSMLSETELAEAKEKIKSLEAQQVNVKKVEEFNALSQELSAAERNRIHREQRLNEVLEHLVEEEETLDKIRAHAKQGEKNSEVYEKEIIESIEHINEEGSGIKAERQGLMVDADADILKVYERLFFNKKDRVIVPVEDRTCSGCNIVLTAQHENLVRKGERLIFCEHCSRIIYWQESEELEDSVVATKKRRRRSSVGKQ